MSFVSLNSTLHTTIITSYKTSNLCLENENGLGITICEETK